MSVSRTSQAAIGSEIAHQRRGAADNIAKHLLQKRGPDERSGLEVLPKLIGRA
jgi:hypothetical protein